MMSALLKEHAQDQPQLQWLHGSNPKPASVQNGIHAVCCIVQEGSAHGGASAARIRPFDFTQVVRGRWSLRQLSASLRAAPDTTNVSDQRLWTKNRLLEYARPDQSASCSIQAGLTQHTPIQFLCMLAKPLPWRSDVGSDERTCMPNKSRPCLVTFPSVYVKLGKRRAMTCMLLQAQVGGGAPTSNICSALCTLLAVLQHAACMHEVSTERKAVCACAVNIGL